MAFEVVEIIQIIADFEAGQNLDHLGGKTRTDKENPQISAGSEQTREIHPWAGRLNDLGDDRGTRAKGR